MTTTEAPSDAPRHTSPERNPAAESNTAPEVTSSADTSPSNNGERKGEEAREGPVRRQLKETSIGEQPAEDVANDTDDSASLRGRTSRKRSFESTREEGASGETADTTASRQVRKRSRDATDAASTELGEGEAKRQSLEEKRSRDATPPPSTDLGTDRAEDVLTSPQQGKRSRAEDTERENAESDVRATKKRPQSPEKKKANPPPAGSGFANFSSQSPFAALSGNASPLAALGQDTKKTDDKQTSAPSFTSLASSATSPFASLGTSKPAEASKEANGHAKPSGFSALAKSSASPFASAGSSSFGSSTSFGAPLGGGFGSASAFGPALSGGRLKSFASPDKDGSPDNTSKPVRAFGAPAADDDEEAEEAEGSDSGDTKDEAVVGESLDQVDDRFHEQETETGEEGEDTVFSARAKLFILDGAWKERGVGVFKLNVRLDDRAVGRFVMRADGSHRVVLNSPVKKGVVDASKPPTDQSLRFLGINTDGSPQLYNLRVRNKETTVALFEKVLDLQSLSA